MAWPLVLLVAPVAIVFAIYNGTLAYIGFRYGTTLPFEIPNWSKYVALWSQMPVQLRLELSCIGFAFGVPVLFAFRMLVANWRRSRQVPGGIDNLHGSARWASADEIRETELLPPVKTHPLGRGRGKGENENGAKETAHRGVVVGGWQESPKKPINILKDGGKNHILAFAPTRSGKGVSLVLPTLLDGWRESALVYDPKGEAWALTSGYRQRELGQRVYRFDPAGTGPDVARFNPLAEIRIDTEHEVADCQNVAQILVDPDGLGLKDHWDRTAQPLLAAVILHVCFVARQKDRAATFGDVERWFGESEGDIQNKLMKIQRFPHRDGRPHPMIASEAQSNLDREKKERSSVVSTALSHLTLYRDPIIAQNVGRGDWSISDLMDDEKPATVYFVVRPADQERLRPLIRLILTQIVRRLTRDMKFVDGQGTAEGKHRLLLLLDEFTSLKRLGIIEDALPYMAGYGIKAMLIVQDLQQLLSVYGKEESLVGNCSLRICFAPNRLETAQIISHWAGDRTITERSFSRSGKRTKLRSESLSESIKQHRRPLILPDEVMRLPGAVKDREGNIEAPGDMLIFSSGARPIYGKQILYFKYPELKRRSNLSPPNTSDTKDEKALAKRRANGLPSPSEAAVRSGGAAGSN